MSSNKTNVSTCHTLITRMTVIYIYIYYCYYFLNGLVAGKTAVLVTCHENPRGGAKDRKSVIHLLLWQEQTRVRYSSVVV